MPARAGRDSAGVESASRTSAAGASLLTANVCSSVCLSTGDKQELPLPERTDQLEPREAQNTEEKRQENAESKLEGEPGVCREGRALGCGCRISLCRSPVPASSALGSCWCIASGCSHLRRGSN